MLDGAVWHSPALAIAAAHIGIAVQMTPTALWGLPAVAAWIGTSEATRRIRLHSPMQLVRTHYGDPQSEPAPEPVQASAVVERAELEAASHE